MCDLLTEHAQALDTLRDSYQSQLDTLTDERDYYKDIVTEHLPEQLI